MTGKPAPAEPLAVGDSVERKPFGIGTVDGTRERDGELQIHVRFPTTKKDDYLGAWFPARDLRPVAKEQIS